MNPTKSELLVDTIEHIDIKKHNVVPLVEAMSKMAFSARDLSRAADINDDVLRRLAIDRIYDAYIDEDQLRVCDATCGEIADSLERRPYSSREFIREMGRYLTRIGKNRESVVLTAFEKEVPIFCPAFSDCSAGFGLIHHQYENPDKHLSIDSARDFLE